MAIVFSTNKQKLCTLFTNLNFTFFNNNMNKNTKLYHICKVKNTKKTIIAAFLMTGMAN